jgi:hypothetical protein
MFTASSILAFVQLVAEPGKPNEIWERLFRPFAGCELEEVE